ncbi:MAG TPA: hypothetical protein PKY63_10595 [Bacteroidales bacterium]|nr:hypothetical protein [Bacteroidales bacterium]
MQTTLSDSDLINIKTLYISPHANQNVNRDVFFFSNIFIFFKIAFFLICCLHAFNKKIKPLNLSLFFKLNLLFDLHLQLVKSLSLKKFVQIQSKTKLIGADYDRGSDSSLFFAVSKSLNIKSFTFQHGVINPPVGYSPVNADEIWVWGGMAKMQLMELNVPEVKIRITGTPIVQDIEISNEIKQSAEIRYGFKHGSNIVLALSVPNKQNDIRLVEFLYHIKSEYGDENYNFCVKIHPARNYEEYKWIKDIYNIDILPHDIPYQDFINFVDVLLSHSSGLAAEVLFFKKKVGILDILDESPGNGIELNKYFRVSLIQQASDFEKLINDPTTNISETLFYKVGYDAKKEIQKNIEYLIA